MTTNLDPSIGQPRDNGLYSFKTPTAPVGVELRPAGTLLALFVDEETGEPVTIIQTDDQEFQAQGPDGNITFRANNNSTPPELAAEAADFWYDDELGERGRGLDSLDEFDQKELFGHYADVALWTATDEDGDSLAVSIADIDQASRKRMTEDLNGFLTANRGYIDRAIATGTYGSWEQVAHDFWLNRNGHGAGFWDRGLGDLGKKLSDASKVYGSVDVTVYDGGKIEVR